VVRRSRSSKRGNAVGHVSRKYRGKGLGPGVVIDGPTPEARTYVRKRPRCAGQRACRLEGRVRSSGTTSVSGMAHHRELRIRYRRPLICGIHLERFGGDSRRHRLGRYQVFEIVQRRGGIRLTSTASPLSRVRFAKRTLPSQSRTAVRFANLGILPCNQQVTYEGPRGRRNASYII
jgi:hypothetical protein